jgi:hypothetical protein
MLAVLLAAAVARPPVPWVVPAFQEVDVVNGQIGWTETVFVDRTVAVVKTRTVERNGRQVTEQYTVTETRPTPEQRRVTVPRTAEFQTPAGKPLAYAQAAEALLRRKAAVRADPTGVVRNDFLALLRDDVVVIRWSPPPPPGALPLP